MKHTHSNIYYISVRVYYYSNNLVGHATDSFGHVCIAMKNVLAYYGQM
jgi:hypothetical protein